MSSLKDYSKGRLSVGSGNGELNSTTSKIGVFSPAPGQISIIAVPANPDEISFTLVEDRTSGIIKPVNISEEDLSGIIGDLIVKKPRVGTVIWNAYNNRLELASENPTAPLPESSDGSSLLCAICSALPDQAGDAFVVLGIERIKDGEYNTTYTARELVGEKYHIVKLNAFQAFESIKDMSSDEIIAEAYPVETEMSLCRKFPKFRQKLNMHKKLSGCDEVES